MYRPYLLLGLFGVGLAHPAAAGTADSPHAHHSMAKEAPLCGEATLACANVASPFMTEDGRLYLAFVAGGKVSLALSADYGGHFTQPVAVSAEPAKIDAGSDSRPSLLIDGRNRILVAWAAFRDEHYNSRAYFSRSVDGGSHFFPPAPVTDDPESQRFPTLVADRGGGIFAAWTDKRNAAAAKAGGKSYPGAALAYAWAKNIWSEDGKAGFGAARMVQDNNCECCRIAAASAGEGRPVVMWRNIFGGTTRDHAVMTFAGPDRPGPVFRVAEDDWEIDACPHHGPALAVAPDGSYHAAWFTEGHARQGLYYARSRDGGKRFSTPLAVGDPDHQPGRPSLLAVKKGVFLAWKEFDGKESTALVMRSTDGGAHWSAPRILGRTAESSDQPVLVADASRVFLSWLTRKEGYRLLPLEDAP